MSDSEIIFDQTTYPSTDYILDGIVPRIRKWSEDIGDFEEEEYYKTRWVQLEQDPKRKDVILHLFFLDDYQYLSSLDGDIIFNGKWQTLEDSNAIILHKVVNKQIMQSELYDLVYLNEDFFILKKHGNQANKGKAKYLFLGNEDAVEGLEWEEILNLLEGSSQSNLRIIITIALIAIVVIGLLAYRFF